MFNGLPLRRAAKENVKSFKRFLEQFALLCARPAQFSNRKMLPRGVDVSVNLQVALEGGGR